MEDNEETGKDAQDGVGNDIMMNDAEVEKEEFSLLDETLVGNKDLSQSMGTKAGNEESPQFEAAKVENKESVLHDNNQNPVATAECIEFPGKGCSPEEQGLAEPSTVISSQTLMNSCISTNKGNNDIADGTQLGALVQFDAIMSSNGSVETQTEDEMEQELENGVTVMEMDPDVSTQEEELKKGEARTDYIQDNKIKNEASNNEVGVLELPQQHEMKNGELNVVVSEIALPPDTEEKDEVLDDILTVTGLSPDNEIDVNNDVAGTEVKANKNEVKKESPNLELDVRGAVEVRNSNNLLFLESSATGGEELGTEEEQATFMKELETFHKEKCLEFKPPRFYGEPLNCLKLWRAVIRLGGYEQVTSCKLWRQVGESFNPPKTCTTVSWTFRCFYEKALLEYEKHKMRTGELPFTDVSFTEPASVSHQVGLHQASGSGRARRDAAARAMQGWHSQRLLGNGEVGDPIIKDKNSLSTPKREKQLKSIGLLKSKKPSSVERAVKAARLKASKPQSDTMVVDIGPPADWVKINVQRTKDCFELYALVPGLLREEVRVQSDPAGRLVISGQPEQLANPWGVTPFKKVVSLPSRIDPHQTSAVVTLHGQLFVRVPFEPSDI